MTEQVQVWISDSGTTAECECGWRTSTPAGVVPEVVTAVVEAHLVETGRYASGAVVRESVSDIVERADAALRHWENTGHHSAAEELAPIVFDLIDEVKRLRAAAVVRVGEVR